MPATLATAQTTTAGQVADDCEAGNGARTAPATRAVTAGRMLFIVVLLLTGAIAMKFGTLLTRSKSFHPNWPAKSVDPHSWRDG